VIIVVLVMVVNHSGSDLPAPSAGVGETVNVARAAFDTKAFWPCGSTEEALGEMTKWAARGDNEEIKRIMVATHSFALTSGLRVKILDIGLGKRRVRVVSDDRGRVYLKDKEGTFLADPTIGRECWVSSDAVSR
jgi:hypothetical protein